MDKSLVVWVWVVMGNDYPHAVFDNEKTADEFIKKMNMDNHGLRIYWRHYVFKLNEGKLCAT